MRHYQLLPLNFGNQITQNINSIYLIEFMGYKEDFLTPIGGGMISQIFDEEGLKTHRGSMFKNNHLFLLINSITISKLSTGFSSMGICPVSSIITTSLFGNNCLNKVELETGIQASCLPHNIKVGV
jgi:hypothetical protein